MWEIYEADLLPVSIGAGILGTGGGRNPYLGYLRVREALRALTRNRVERRHTTNPASYTEHQTLPLVSNSNGHNSCSPTSSTISTRKGSPRSPSTPRWRGLRSRPIGFRAGMRTGCRWFAGSPGISM